MDQAIENMKVKNYNKNTATKNSKIRGDNRRRFFKPMVVTRRHLLTPFLLQNTKNEKIKKREDKPLAHYYPIVVHSAENPVLKPDTNIKKHKFRNYQNTALIQKLRNMS